MKKISIITLGCSKNLVDSERIARQFAAAGYTVLFDTDEYTDAIIINTCGFIHDAKEESIAVILNAIRAKEAGRIRQVYVIGCLAERYADDLRKEIPEVDSYFGVRDIYAVLQSLNLEAQTSIMHERVVSTPRHTAYLKIAEGCNRSCSFCAIPLIRGPHISEPIEKLVAEASYLVQSGAKELSIISQDVSYYGIDIYNEHALAGLLNQLLTIDGLDWIRLQYLYPNNFPLQVLDIMQQSQRLCNYLDMPLQHISDKVLQNMRRGFSAQKTYELLDTIRAKVPDVALRTTLIVGHPGETEKEFQKLFDFVRDVKFDRLGVFTYSHEEQTYAADNFKDSIPQKVKQERADALMELQQDISLQKNTALIGSTHKVLIDRIEGDCAIGRTQYDAFEVDNEVRINQANLSVGNFYSITITDADVYDIFGVVS
jgi:ribosomal protein S12 methylthiotransferase